MACCFSRGSQEESGREGENVASDWRRAAGVVGAKLTSSSQKVDFRLIPLLTLLYLFSFIDRANIGMPFKSHRNRMHVANPLLIGNANIEGLSETLGLSGTQFNIALSIFFVPYVLLGQSLRQLMEY